MVSLDLYSKSIDVTPPCPLDLVTIGHVFTRSIVGFSKSIDLVQPYPLDLVKTGPMFTRSIVQFQKV